MKNAPSAFRRHKWLLLLSVSFIAVTGLTPLRAEPVNPTVQVGTVGSIGDAANGGGGITTTIDQTSNQLYIDWESFNIGTNDIVSFQQGGSDWIAVNRVTGGALTPTTIDGMLTAPGHVWILDPAGIAFGAGAVVDVGGLLATTANIDPVDFAAVTNVDDPDGYTFTDGGNATAQVSNAGTIQSSGLLALVAPIVDNSGTLTSEYGDVLLGGASGFRVSFSAVERPADIDHPTPFNELLVTDFIVETPVTNDPTPLAETVPVNNTGNVTGANVIVSAASVGGGAFINMDGVVEATSVGDQSGNVVILGGGDYVAGAADPSSGATDNIRIKNADITASTFVAQGTNVDIEKGTGPGTISVGSVRLEATSGDVTTDAALTSTEGGIEIVASGLASLKALDANTTVSITADDIDLDGLINGDTSVTLEATGTDISGTDINIEGGSVELTGAVTATDSATIKALVSDATLNDDLTSTGSVLIEALLGKVSVKGVDADTTTTMTADDIDLDGLINGDTSVTLEATGTDISGTDINIEGGSVELTGAVTATDSATIKALTSDVTLNDDLTSTGSVLIEALLGKASVKGVDADTTTTMTADDIDLDGLVKGDTSVTLEATGTDISGTDINIEGGSVELTGAVTATDSATIKALTSDATLNDDLTSTGSVLIEALLGKASVKGVDADTTTTMTADDIDLDGLVKGDTSVTLEATGTDISGTDIDIEGGSVELTGAVTATDSVTIKALTSDATLNDDLTSTGSVLIEALLGKASVKGVDADTTTTMTADDIDLDGLVKGDTSVTLEATGTDISGTDIDIEGGSVELTGAVTATDSATIKALVSDVTLNDDLTSTGSVLIEALLGKVSVKGVDADTTTTITADDIDLDGLIKGDTSVTLEATGTDISGTDINIEGGSVELTGAVTATDSATIKALTSDVTLNDDLTSTGSVLIEALLGKVSVKGVDADTTTTITADDIDLDGLVNGDTSVTLEATGTDISGTDINIEGGSVELTGAVTATDSATIKALTSDVTLNDDLTSTGSVLIEALLGKVSVKGVDADTTTTITADDIDLDGLVNGDTSVTLEATGTDISGTDIDIEGGSVELTGTVTATDSATIKALVSDATLNDDLTSTGSVLIEALLGKVSVKGVDADTTTTITADDIDLDGLVNGDTSVTLEATGTDISGTDIDIEGGSVELTGTVTATDSATIKALVSDATLNDDLTSTGSVLIEAKEGKATTAGLDADTTLDVTANDIEVNGAVTAGGDLNMTAESDDIYLHDTTEAANVKLTAMGDVTADDTITSTVGYIDIDPAVVKLTKLVAETTIDVTGNSIELSGDATANGHIIFTALTGNATLSGLTKSNNSTVRVEAKTAKASVNDVESQGDTTIIGGSVDVLGDLVAQGAVTLQALLGNVDIQGSVTANGGLLLLDAAHGDAVINDIASNSNVSIIALDLDLSGTISAADEVRLASLDSGTTIVLGGDGGTDGVTLRYAQGLTIDADELSRISAGNLRIDAANNDALLMSVNFAGATLGDLTIGAGAASQIIAAGTVTGLDTLTLGYVDGLEDRRPGLILVSGELGLDTTTGRLGSVELNSSQDIIIGSQAFQTYYETSDPTLSQLGKPNLAAMGVASGHIFIAADSLKLNAPGDIVQLNTGSGVDGKGIVFKVAAIDEGVLNPVDEGPEKVVLFGQVIRDDGTRITSYSAGLEPRILFPGIKDSNGDYIEDPLVQTGEYHFNLCVIGDPVSCSNALLREAEPTGGVSDTDPNPYLSPAGLTFDDDDEDDEEEDDLGGVAATGNESLWGVGIR